MHLIIFVNNAMGQAQVIVDKKTMCLPYGIIDKDNEMHNPS